MKKLLAAAGVSAALITSAVIVNAQDLPGPPGGVAAMSAELTGGVTCDWQYTYADGIEVDNPDEVEVEATVQSTGGTVIETVTSSEETSDPKWPSIPTSPA